MNYNKQLLQINQRLKKTLSKERYQHSIRVMKKAIEYAKIYDIEEEKAKITALAHDMAREMSKEDSRKYICDNNLPKDLLEEINFPLIHGAIAADICKKEYQFTDDMINAIFYHTTGRKNMSNLEKIIYLADKNEEGRNYLGLEEQRKLATQSLDKAMIAALIGSIKHCQKNYSDININSLEALRHLQQKNQS